MRILLSDFNTEREKIELFVIPEKTTVRELGELYLKEFNHRYNFTVEGQTYGEYEKPWLSFAERQFLTSRIDFFHNGKKYTAGSFGDNKKLSEIIDESEIINDACFMVVSRSVYARNNRMPSMNIFSPLENRAIKTGKEFELSEYPKLRPTE